MICFLFRTMDFSVEIRPINMFHRVVRHSIAAMFEMPGKSEREAYE